VGRGLIKLARAPSVGARTIFPFHLHSRTNICRREPKAKARGNIFLWLCAGRVCVCAHLCMKREIDTAQSSAAARRQYFSCSAFVMMKKVWGLIQPAVFTPCVLRALLWGEKVHTAALFDVSSFFHLSGAGWNPLRAPKVLSHTLYIELAMVTS
jgi:hypothetical protein